MFLAPGQKVTLRELLLGLAVSSGNDAAVAVALHLAPSVEAFAQRMNEAVEALGLRSTSFVEPSGYSENNTTTAREFAQFCAFYLKRHPEVLLEYHSVREFSYPKPENLPETFRDRPGTVVQYNRNLLLDEAEGVDGLKTGFIIESGYNIALTAQRDGTRFLAVLLGGPGSGSAQGGRFRAEDGGGLLNWAFARYRTVRPELRHLDPVRVWKGSVSLVDLVPAEALEFTVDRNRARQIFTRVEREAYVSAPIQEGRILGTLIFSDAEGDLRRVPLAAVRPVGRGNFLIRAIDSVRLFLLRLTDRLFN
jgi:D-alanyl-D-alanine carboxypeptidase (penicillin-binding protein 5/6)